MRSTKHPKRWPIYLCCFTGALLGSAGVLALAIWVHPNPMSRALASSIATLGRSEEKLIQIADVQKIAQLIDSGYILTTNELLQSVSGYYGSIIQLLLAIIGLIAAGAYLTIRSNSLSHIEDTMDTKLTDATGIYFESSRFHDAARSQISGITAVEFETIYSDIDQIRSRIDDLGTAAKSFDAFFRNYADKQSPEEPSQEQDLNASGDEVPPATPTRKARQRRTSKEGETNGR